jgi:hypothetical protein
LNFEKWFQGTPKIFKNMVLIYISPSLEELILVMDKADPCSERRIEFGSKLQILMRIYDDFIFEIAQNNIYEVGNGNRAVER